MDLQEEFQLTYMFVTHNLSVVKHISTDIVVMYLGQCVEMAPCDELFIKPMHPYSKALLSAIPIPDISMRHRDIDIIKGEVTNPINPAIGCRFATRCEYTTNECIQTKQKLVEVLPNHSVLCCRVKELNSL
jgi:oligopeptide/dipeptide ABC transporter ATP-binding protein